MKRYPGIRPFRSDEQHLFFGRDTDTERLLRLIDLQQLVILYGKSGYGKSSLLSAGVFPRLQADGHLQPWEIRLGPYKPGESLPPAESLRLAVGRRVSDHPILPSSLAEPSLWQSLKNLQTTENKRFLLVFDQFEELFTYPSEQVLAFKKQLAEALFSVVPKRYEKALASANLPPETEDAIYTPFELKVVFSIRADRMSLLNGLKDYLPNLLQHGYELDALDEASAKEAILRPAALPDIEFETPPYSFAPDALGAIFTALRDEQGRIETSTLQIVCKHVEDNIISGWMTSGRRADGTSVHMNGQRIVTAVDLGDISAIFRDFYENTLASLPNEEHLIARTLIEDVLIKDGIRLPFAEQALLAQPGVSADLLQRLSAASLLRVERDDQGRMLYEVGHDTLVRPIEEAAKARRETEKREAEERRLKEEDERQRQERKKIEAARRRNILVGLVAFALLAFAFYQTWVANKAKEEAKAMTIKAQQSEALAVDKTTEAGNNLKKAEVEQEKARLALLEVDKQTNATEEQKQLARQNLAAADRALALARQATADVVQSLLENAANSVYHLRYAEALATLQKAAGLGQKKPEVARALFEIAFYFHETGQTARADSLAADIAGLLALRDTDLTTFKKLSNLPALQPSLQAFRTKYYSEFVDVPGGQYAMSKTYTAEVSPYKIATTETTWWQYNLFCAATGKKVTDHSPSWGLDGDNPAVNVNWYDAVEYANWLSIQHDLTPAYQIDSLKKDPNNLNEYDDYKWTVTLVPNAKGYRLPIEAEWQYAAANAGRDAFEFAGDSILQNVGWYGQNSALNGVSRTHPVAGKKQNDLGLYDMSGNVWEWCYDWYGDYPEGPVKDYRGPDKGSHRIRRGGSWFDVAVSARVAYRLTFNPSHRSYYYGFRLARAR